MERIIMHIDVNNAFLSWTALYLLEQGYQTDIRNIEAIIAGDPKKRSGIVLAKSTPAKRKGIKTAETIYEAKRKCPNLKIFKPTYEMYKRKSEELFNLLKTYTPDIEKASVDEGYLDYGKIKNIYGDELEFAKKIQKQIKEELGFTVNIGEATTYAEIRAKWLSLDHSQKMEQDSFRTACHNSVITHFNMMARYLKSQGKNTEWRDALGYEEDDKYFRKTIGDFGCYIVFINSLCAR